LVEQKTLNLLVLGSSPSRGISLFRNTRRIPAGFSFPGSREAGKAQPQTTMIAFRVLHNGQKVCIAGIGEQGVLDATVHWVRVVRDSPPAAEQEIALQIGGLDFPTQEHRH
jgi:hypothetical protein